MVTEYDTKRLPSVQDKKEKMIEAESCAQTLAIVQNNQPPQKLDRGRKKKRI